MNQANRGLQKNNKSGFKGISFCKHRCLWKSAVGVRGKRLFLGYYETPESAAEAYDAAAIKHFGEFAKTNAAIAAMRGGE